MPADPLRSLLKTKAAFVEPMDCLPVSKLPEGSQWVWEIKLDSYRAGAAKSSGAVTLYSRNRKILNKRFPYILEPLRGLPDGTVVDGEIVCLDSAGRSQFNELLHRRGNPAFYAFDLLWLNGRDLRELPMVKRKQRLQKLIQDADRPGVIYAQHIETNGTALYKKICKLDLEGIVCKKKDSRYSTTVQWLKVMNPDYTQHDGRHEMFTVFRERSSRAR